MVYHVCKATVQLHFVQEMIEQLQSNSNEESDSDSEQHEQSSVHSIRLSAAAMGKEPEVPVLQLEIDLQGHKFQFLVDSGSTHSFMDLQHSSFAGVIPIKTLTVTVAGGSTIQCQQQIKNFVWQCNGAKFISDFKLLPLQTYDGILGLDSLAQHSPMYVDWVEKWLSFNKEGQTVTLHGIRSEECSYTCVSIFAIQVEGQAAITPEIQLLLQEFADVFETPTQLPPRRDCDHKINLIPGARPITVRPYRIAPQLKDELEKQIAEMLKSGVIRPSKSPFSSPVILVKKKGGEWRLVVDYRMLNAITIKGKFPVHLIDKLLDELAGAAWFTKIDLRAGYHQIRLAAGEE